MRRPVYPHDIARRRRGTEVIPHACVIACLRKACRDRLNRDRCAIFSFSDSRCSSRLSIATRCRAEAGRGVACGARLRAAPCLSTRCRAEAPRHGGCFFIMSCGGAEARRLFFSSCRAEAPRHGGYSPCLRHCMPAKSMQESVELIPVCNLLVQ